MKLFTFTITITLFLFSISNSYSQGFYVSASSGYAFGQNTNTDWLQNTMFNGYWNQNTGEVITTEEFEVVPFSLGKGFNFGLSVGYMINDYVGVDVGVTYLIGGVTEAYDVSSFTETYVNGVVTISNRKGITKLYSNMLRVIPSIVLTPNFEKWNPYTRFGVVLGFGSFNIDYESTNENVSVSTYLSKSEFKDGVAIGFNGVLGLSYLLNEKISVFSEVNYIGMSYAPKKFLLTEMSQDGVDKMPDLDTYQKEIEYVSKYVYNRDEFDENQPDIQLKISTPFSSIGVNFGVRYSF